MNHDDTVYACALNRIFAYSCAKGKALAERFPSPGEIFSLGRGGLEDIFGKGSPFVEKISDKSILDKAEGDVAWARKMGIPIIYIGDREYPGRLRECPDAPIVLFYKGTAGLNPEHAISVVGTRRPTAYGLRICREIIKELSCTEPAPLIISGLAYGIDITAHIAAMENGVGTLGVMATGLDCIYPHLHREYAARMAGCGGLVTDFPPGSRPLPVNFLKRNRIIAGISDGVIVIESNIKGGSMITAGLASSYSRPVYAVPGKIGDHLSAGCNELIRQNIAEIIACPGDIVGQIGWKKSESPVDQNKTRTPENYDSIKRNILLALSSRSVQDTDSLVMASGADRKTALRKLAEMEIEGTVIFDSYGNYMLKDI